LTEREVLNALLAGAPLPEAAVSLALDIVREAQQRDKNAFRRIAAALEKTTPIKPEDESTGRRRLATLAVEQVAKAVLVVDAESFLELFEDRLKKVANEDKLDAALKEGLLQRLFAVLAAAPLEARPVLETFGEIFSIPIPSGAGSTGPSSEPPNPKELPMSFYMDLRGLPPDAPAEAQYLADTKAHLKKVLGNVDPNEIAVFAVVGKLLRGGQFRTDTSSFASFVKRAYDDLVVPFAARGSQVFTGIEVLLKIAEVLKKKGTPVAYQQLAFILDEAVATLPVIAANDAGFETRVERAYLDYASGDVGNDLLNIPQFDQSIDTDIIPENMLAVGKVYAAYQLEQLKLFAVVDRIAELWRNGLVPIGSDSGGRLLNDFWWAREDRLSEANRGTHYGRLFGTKGVDVSKEVQPNTQFDALMLRFLTNVAQYKRLTEMQVVSADPGQSKSLVSENVRKTGRELAANLSLYGWGATHFDASRIAGHVKVAFDIVKDPQVQKAFAATTPWQVIERVSQQEFGVTPNIVKYQTMATSGQEVIRILASQPGAFVSSVEEIHLALKPSPQTFDSLARHALAWLSVSGTSTEQLARLSQPIEAIASPALPQFGSSSHTNGSSPDLARLREMMATGRMPSLEELRGFIN
jgi:hypothetical protein